MVLFLHSITEQRPSDHQYDASLETIKQMDAICHKEATI